jgi:hypothetical protein
MATEGKEGQPRRKEPEIIDPYRIRNFARFFKNYMSVSSLVVAALPIPIGQLDLLPVPPLYIVSDGSDSGQIPYGKSVTSVLTRVFCFLTLGFIFYCRHVMARLMFPEFVHFSKAKRTALVGAELKSLGVRSVRLAPCLLICLSFCLFFFYINLINNLSEKK